MSSDLDHSPVLFALIGPIGSGRSSFANVVLGREAAAAGVGLDSCTTKVALYDYPHPKRGRIGVIDTPGLNQSPGKESQSDDKILKSIDTFLREKYGANQRLSGIIFLQDINSANKVNWNTKQRCKTLFKKLCGTKSAMNVVVVTTFWDRLSTREDGIRREEELQTEEGFLKDLYDGGTKFFRFGHFESGEHALVGDPTFPTPQEVLEVLLEPPGRMSVEEQEQGGNNNGHTVPANGSSAEPSVRQYQDLQEERLDGLQEDNNQMQRRIMALEERLSQYATKAELSTLKTRYEDDIRGIQAQVSELQQASDERNKDDRQRLEYLTKELERVRQDRDTLDKERKELRAKLEGALDDRFKGLDASLAQATQSYNHTRESLQASLEQTKHDHAETKRELDSLKVVHDKEHEDLEELKAWHRASQHESIACNLQ